MRALQTTKDSLTTKAPLRACSLLLVWRRRARNIDRELAEAASAGPAPIYLDDEPDRDMGRSMYSGAAGGYSDLSHGTYNQKPLETYSMSEMGPGAAGVGVQRQRSMGGQQWAPTDNGWAAAGESQNPYPAFAVPGGYQPSQAYDGPNYHPDAYHGGYDDNYGYYGAAAYEQPRERSPPLPPLPTQSPPHEQQAETLSRSRSKSLLNYGQGGATPPTPPTPPAESYAAHYALPGGSGPSGGNISAGGSQSGHMANPYDEGLVNRNSAGSIGSREDSDDEDDGPQPKVLKVANE
ncbi:hypothetical protein CYLTODRAFT_232261 [Cylindrobasidium torrendii FP15055 ss-10]|uniref:Uncharacterized protein n=1 Tax=Cylindrobasidium torrendii FP15055 ss-10 TaxID=1314674 RepID=A0A0D7BI30_9AGAR|nr:hypothetical protein CYLTODRAFT_232261 [Cylindrobasidium torrendii FP15055 ss-10]